MRPVPVAVLATLGILASAAPALADEIADTQARIEGRAADMKTILSRRDGLPPEVHEAPAALAARWAALLPRLGRAPELRVTEDAHGNYTVSATASEPTAEVQSMRFTSRDAAAPYHWPAMGLEVYGPKFEPLEATEVGSDEAFAAAGTRTVFVRKQFRAKSGVMGQTFTRFTAVGRTTSDWLVDELKESTDDLPSNQAMVDVRWRERPSGFNRRPKLLQGGVLKRIGPRLASRLRNPSSTEAVPTDGRPVARTPAYVVALRPEGGAQGGFPTEMTASKKGARKPAARQPRARHR